MKSNSIKSKKDSGNKRENKLDLHTKDICVEHKIVFTDKIFASAFHYAAIGMSLIAPDGHYLAVNNSLCKLVGYSEFEMLSKKFQDITNPEDIDKDISCFKKIIAYEIETYQREKRYIHRNGKIINVMLNVSLVRDDNEKPLFFVSQIQDITARKQLERELVKLATEDYLTGVSTRRRFFEFARRELTRGGRFCESMTLLMIDIDNFKKINDSYGHDIGDEVLKSMALTCQNTLRAVDVFGRLGGEEFGALLVNTGTAVGKLVAERLRINIERLAVKTEKGVVRFTVSIGAVAFTGGGQSLEHRLKQADIALYEAKNAGRNIVKIIVDVEDLDDSFERKQTGFIRLNWKESYECGNYTIDSQHRDLFDLSNNLLNALLSGQPKHACEQLINELIEHTAKHFRDEDAIFRLANYPYADIHTELHSKLVHDMGIIAESFSREKVSVGELFGFLAVEVISRHMLEEDRKFFPYITCTKQPPAKAGGCLVPMVNL